MAEELSPEDVVPDAPTGNDVEPSGGGSGFDLRELVRKNLKLLILLFCGSGALATAVALFTFRQESPPEVVPEKREVHRLSFIPSSRDFKLKELRSSMRSSYRSSHNQYLVKKRGPEEMIWLTSQGELTLLSGLFNHYLVSTARFFEVFRIMSNDYISRKEEVLSLFKKELLPDFESAERKRNLLRRRIGHVPAKELLGDLDYIAFYDSIAVFAFQIYMDSSKISEFNRAVDNVNTAKHMIREFWTYFKVHLENYRIDFKPPTEIWLRYYDPWYQPES